MRISEFDYNLPKNLIAQKPISPRDHSRLMVLDKKSKSISHRHFYDIGDFLKPGDVLVLNDSKVLPARILGEKKTGGKVEILLIQPNIKNLKNYSWSDEWWAIGKPGLSIGSVVKFGKSLEAEVLKSDNYKRLLKFNYQGEKLRKIIYQIGQAPTPPYINSIISSAKLKKQYQTIYAKNIGSVAASTAGFHFTPQLIKKLKSKGVILKYVTLHVGPGTFLPVKVSKIENHKMMPEWGEIDRETSSYLNKAKKNNQRIIAVGTTATRTLEFFSDIYGKVRPGTGFIDLFIYPGYKFKVIDGLITNFHLPKSTLLMLACALAGKKLILNAYQRAIKEKYRFFSFGDAMFIQ